MRASRGAVLFGTLALIGLPFNPPSHVNALFFVFMVCAGLGALCGLLGLFGPRRGLALIGLGLSVASPFVAVALAPPTGYRNESPTLGDIRTVMASEDAYKDINGGFYGTPECLAAPAACIAGYHVSGPAFLDSSLASGAPKSGYARRFVAGPPAPGGQRGSMTTFAYVAVPTKAGVTGVRGFCGDSRGEICATTEGQVPPVVDGLCVTYDEDKSSPCVQLR